MTELERHYHVIDLPRESRELIRQALLLAAGCLDRDARTTIARAERMNRPQLKGAGEAMVETALKMARLHRVLLDAEHR